MLDLGDNGLCGAVILLLSGIIYKIDSKHQTPIKDMRYVAASTIGLTYLLVERPWGMAWALVVLAAYAIIVYAWMRIVQSSSARR